MHRFLTGVQPPDQRTQDVIDSLKPLGERMKSVALFDLTASQVPRYIYLLNSVTYDPDEGDFFPQL